MSRSSCSFATALSLRSASPLPELETARSYSGPKRSESLPRRRLMDTSAASRSSAAPTATASTIHSQVSTDLHLLVPRRVPARAPAETHVFPCPAGGKLWRRSKKETVVNEDQVKGKVKEVEGESQQTWGKVKDKADDAKDMGEDLVDEAKDRLSRDEETSDDAARQAERA